MSTMILDRVSADIAGTTILDTLSTRLDTGTFVAILGPNGAGKSTLLRAIAGLIPARGTLTLDGRAIVEMSVHQRARQIGYLPQGHETHWPLSVADIVGLGRFPHGATDPRRLPPADADAVRRAMDDADVTQFASRRANALSGGERARVALARILAQETPVILADEPTASLEPRYQIEVMRLLSRVAAGGRLVIAVLHDLDLAARYADRAIVLDRGRIAADGTVADALNADICHRVFGIRQRSGGGWEIA